MTFLVFFSGWQFILIPAEVKRTSATLCSFHFLEFFNSSIFWGSSSSRLSLFPILGPHGLPFRRWALVLTRRGSFWDSLGPVWQTILRWQACFLFKKNLKTRVTIFATGPRLTHVFWLLIRLDSWGACFCSCCCHSSWLLSWKALWGCSLRLICLRFFNTCDSCG